MIFQSEKYELVEKIGAGGMSVVYKARHLPDERIVAIKLIKELALGQEAIWRFEREARATERLKHPHIVKALEQGRAGPVYFLALEFIDGPNLKEYIQSHPEQRCDLGSVLQLGSQIAQALDYAHGQGILHRDVKPENIMITAGDQAKLMDFGLARIRDETVLTRTGALLGTAAYMPPEQPLGQAVDHRSDLYSLGCVLYYMSTGRLPFSGDNLAHIIFSHINDAPRRPRRLVPEIPQELENIILKLMAKAPDDRFQSAADLLAALQAVDASSPGAADIPRPEKHWQQSLIGRQEELARLKGCLDGALQGSSQMVFLTGEAGLGKTRLAHELSRYASLRGVLLLTGRGQRGERIPYRPWLEPLQTLIDQTPAEKLAAQVGEFAAELAQLIPELERKLQIVPAAQGLQPARQRKRLFDGIAQLLSSCSAQKPLLLLLDDLQWADEGTLQLLRHSMHQVKKSAKNRLLIIGIFRELKFAAGHPLSAALTELNRDRLYEPIGLTRLEAEAVGQMIRQTFGENVSAELERLVYRKTAGNPFFVEELLRALLNEQIVIFGPNGWETPDISQVKIPGSVRAIIKEKVSRLPEATGKVLNLAAVIGREFSFPVLQAMAGLAEEALIEQIEDGLQARLLIEQPVSGDEIYAFADNLVREVLYEEISAVRRRRYHARAGQALEEVYGARAADYAEALAYHFLQGNQVDKAAGYSVRAGDRAAAIYAWPEAAGHYKTALDLLDEAQVEQRAAVLSKLANTALTTGQPDASLDYLEQALQLYEQLNDSAQAVRTHMFIVMLYTGGAWDGAREVLALDHLQRVEALTQDDPDSMEKGRIYEHIAHIHLHRGEPAQALVWLQKTVDLYDKLDRSRITQYGTALIYTGLIDEGLAYNRQKWPAVLKLGNPLIFAVYGHQLLLSLALLGNIPEARRWAEKIIPEAEKIGMMAQFLINRSLPFPYILSAESKQAQDYCDQRLLFDNMSLAGCHFEEAGSIGLHYLRQGKWQEARSYLLQGIESHQERRNFGAVNSCSYVLGRLELEMGHYDAAERRLQESLSRCRETGNVIFELWVLPALAELHMAAAQREKAAASLEQGFALLTPGQNWYGLPAPLYAAQGLLAAQNGQPDKAATSFEQALTLARRYELLWDEARTLYYWGCLAKQLGQMNEAKEKMALALAHFQKLGAAKEIDKIHSLGF